MRSLLLCAAAVVLGACGDGSRDGPAAPEPRTEATAVPAEVIARLREEAMRHEADDADGSEVLTAALDLVERGAEAGSEERQVVLTAWMRTEIVDGRVERAAEAWRALRREHDGRGRTPTAHPIRREAMAGGLAEGALDAARARVEGSAPDAAAAARALAVAEEAAEDAEDPDVGAAVERTRRWLAVGRLADFPAGLAPFEGPRVVALADDFLLGETEVVSVLGRWARSAEDRPLRVGVVPVLRGTVRAGLRRVPATEEEERRSVAARAEAAGLVVEPVAVPAPDLGRRLGLEPRANAVLLLDASGRVVARASGTTPDLRALEAAVQRLLSR